MDAGTGPPEPATVTVEQVREITEQETLADAYAFLQRLVAVVALLLAPVVALGDYLIDGHGLRGSISSYYYGRTGGYFVGSLCALAVFFLSYDYRPRAGHDADNRLSNLASIAALGVALFPTSSAGEAATGGSLAVARVHVASAAVLFVCLAVFSLYHFTKLDYEGLDTGSAVIPWPTRIVRIFRDPLNSGLPSRHEVIRTVNKRRRNRFHRICGWLIVASIIGIVVNNLLDWGLMFWLETIAVTAFSISWLVKSGWPKFLSDAPQ